MPFRLGPMEMLVLLCLFGIIVATLVVPNLFKQRSQSTTDRQMKFAQLHALTRQLSVVESDSNMCAEAKQREIQILKREIGHLEAELYD